MSLIACTSGCVYQKDGYCTLTRAAATGALCGPAEPCVNFMPRSEASQDRSECFPDISDTN